MSHAQLDLFAARPIARPRPVAKDEVRGEEKGVGLRHAADVLARVHAVSQRPRYSFLVLGFIVQVADDKGEAGPRVRVGDRTMPVRDWLADSLFPVGARDSRRVELFRRTRELLAGSGDLPADPIEADAMVEAEVRAKLLPSSRSAISRSVSDLVRAGCLKRRYAGHHVDHENRGAQREAVYIVPSAVREALRDRSAQASDVRPALPVFHPAARRARG